MEKSLVQQFKEWIDSEEGKLYLENYLKKEKQEEEILESQLERFKSRFSSIKDFDYIVNKIIDKYESDEYVLREYKMGREPNRNLYWFLFRFAEKYGREVTEEEYEKYSNMFTDEMYYYGGYYFSVMHGQGSVIKIDKNYS